AVAVGAVGRSQVFEEHLGALLDDAGVIARDAVVQQPQVGLVAAADDRLVLLQLVHLAHVGPGHHDQVGVVLSRVAGRRGLRRPRRVVERISDALGPHPCYFTDRRAGRAISDEMEMNVLTGTSGFSYTAWRGSFYPDKLPEAKMLAFYAAELGAVEI